VLVGQSDLRAPAPRGGSIGEAAAHHYDRFSAARDYSNAGELRRALACSYVVLAAMEC